MVNELGISLLGGFQLLPLSTTEEKMVPLLVGGSGSSSEDAKAEAVALSWNAASDWIVEPGMVMTSLDNTTFSYSVKPVLLHGATPVALAPLLPSPHTLPSPLCGT